MRKLEFKPQDRQSIDFAEEERKRLSNEGAIVHANKLNKICAGRFVNATYTTSGAWGSTQIDIYTNYRDSDYYNSGNREIEIKKAGIYKISAEVYARASCIIGLKIVRKKNDGTIQTLVNHWSSGSHIEIPVSIVKELRAGDSIWFELYGESGSAVNIEIPSNLGESALYGWDIINISTTEG